MSLNIYPLTSERWKDLEALFGRAGADGGCWCMFWRFTAKEYSASTSVKNKQALKTLVEQGSVPGLLAYQDNQAAGWIGLGPRPGFGRLMRSRLFTTTEDPSVWSIVCFFVHREYRQQKITAALLDAAVQYAREQGAASLEGYPIQAWEKGVSANSAYVGTQRMFEQAGFHVAAESASRSGGVLRVVMRRKI